LEPWTKVRSRRDLPRLRRKRLLQPDRSSLSDGGFPRQWSQPISHEVTLHAKNGARGIKRIDLAYVELASSETPRDINRDIVLGDSSVRSNP